MNLTPSFVDKKHTKSTIAKAIAYSLFLVLPSCRIPNLGLADAAPPVPPDYNVTIGPENHTPLAAVVGGIGVAKPANGAPAVENSAQLSVEEFYNDPVLTQLIHEGLAGNRELKIQEQEIVIARNEVQLRRGAYLPFVTAAPSITTSACGPRLLVFEDAGRARRGTPSPLGCRGR